MTDTQCVEHPDTTSARCFWDDMPLFEDPPPFSLTSPTERESGRLPGRISVSRNGDNHQPSFRPITNRSSRSKMNQVSSRPSTAYNGTPTLYENEPCPGPTVSRSQDNMDVHEALRLHIPPFRQSRRWAKAYTTANAPLAQATLSRKPSLGKHSQRLNRDRAKSAEILKIDDAVQRSDTDSDHYGGCKPVTVPGWHAFKQRRLLKRHSIPSKSPRCATLRNHRQVKSAKSLEFGVQCSPRRAGMPKLVQSKSVGKLRQQGQTEDSVVCQETRDVTDTLQLPGPSKSRSGPDAGDVEHAKSPVRSLHDPQKVRRFSQECVDILALNSGDDWRLSVFGPLLETSIEKTAESHASARDKSLDRPFEPRKTNSISIRPLSIDKAPDPPVRTSSKRGGTAGSTYVKQIGKPVRLPVLESFGDAPTHTAHDADDEADDRLSLLKHSIRRDRSKTNTGPQSRLKNVKDLKAVRSVDTLSRIEAQVTHTRSDTSLIRLRGNTLPAQSPSLTTATPSGSPPERPLPDLPQAERSDLLISHERPSTGSGRENDGSDALTKVQGESLKMSSIHTMLAIPSCPPVRAEDVTSHEKNATTSSSRTSAENLCYADRIAQSTPVQDSSSQSSSVEMVPCATLKAKGVASHRSSRIQEIKKRHLAAWSKSVYSLNTRDNSGEDEPLLGTGSHTHDLRLTYDLDKPVEPSTSRNSDNGDNDDPSTPQQYSGKCDDGFEISELDKFPAVPITPPNSQPRPTGDLKPLHDLHRKLSRRSSKSQRQAVENRLLNGASSSRHPRESSKKPAAVKQNLGHSQIMVVVDTNPHTSSFRAGAMSPNSNSVRMTSRPSSPIVKIPAQTSHPPAHMSFTAHLSDVTQSTSIGVPVREYPSQNKLGLHKERSCQLDPQRPGTSSGGQIVQQVLPSSCNSRVGSSQCHYFLNDDSGSEGENSGSIQVPKSSRKITRKLHRRQDTPLTTMLKDEVKRADEELENLKKYEKRIECLQMQLEETLEIWGRMRQGEKKQYLASNFGDAESQSGANIDHSLTDTAARSTSSKASSSSRSHREKWNVSSQAGTAPKAQSIEDHRISNASDLTFTGTGTGTDTDNSVQAGRHQPGKRASDGSLTDPQDYDVTALLPHKIGQAKAVVEAGCQASTTECSDPSCDTHVSSSGRSRLCPTPIMSQESFMSPQERARVVPWEQHGHTIPSPRSSTDTLSNHRLSINHEIFRTDQMDALLVM